MAWLGAAGAGWRQWRGARTLLGLAALGLIAISGAVAYEFFLWRHYDDPLVYARIQKYWDSPSSPVPAPRPGGHGPADPLSWALDGTRTALAPWVAVEHRVTSLSFWNKGWTLLLLVVTGGRVHRPGPAAAAPLRRPLLIFLMAYLPNPSTLAGQQRVLSIARYETAALPCFYLVAWWLRAHPRTVAALIVALLAFQCLYAASISRGWWAG